MIDLKIIVGFVLVYDDYKLVDKIFEVHNPMIC